MLSVVGDCCRPQVPIESKLNSYSLLQNEWRHAKQSIKKRMRQQPFYPKMWTVFCVCFVIFCRVQMTDLTDGGWSSLSRCLWNWSWNYQILWSPAVHHRVKKSPYFELFESSLHLTSYFPGAHFNVILPSTPRSLKWSPVLGPSSHSFEWTSHNSMHELCYIYLILLDLVTRTI